MKKVLIIDESKPFRRFLTQKLARFDISVAQAINGVDAVSKLRSIHPDLIIMDFHLSRMSSVDVLKAKMQDPNTANTPVIMVSGKIARNDLLQVGSCGIQKFFFKPIKLDEFIAAVGKHLNMSISVDDTPSVIEANVNDGVLFLEIALGLNVDKIDLMQFKIGELMDLYNLSSPRVLIMLSGVDVTSADSIKLRALLETAIESSGTKPRNMVLLTQAPLVEKLVKTNPDFNEIALVRTLTEAMPLLQNTTSHDGESFLRSSKGGSSNGAINMRFSTEKASESANMNILENAVVAIVDDDPIVRELARTTFENAQSIVQTYENGRHFIEDADVSGIDLVFLDIIMPEMDGFRVLQNLRKKCAGAIMPPVIIFSAVSRKDAVVTALRNGVKSYLIKPINPNQLRNKAIAVLNIDFS